MQKLVYLSLMTLFLSLSSGCSSTTHYTGLAMETAYLQPRVISNFPDYVHFLKQKAAQAGVSTQVLNAHFPIEHIEKAVELDQKQAARKRHPNLPPPKANPNGLTRYLARVLTPAKVQRAVEQWQQHHILLSQTGQKYGVEPVYLLALWGMESSFGRYQGDFDVLSVLATLAFDGRRETLFTAEFVNALKMLDQGVISRTKMKGSWAGAMGQTQFMPSSYLNYAVDADNDGQKDIWQNHADAFASIANYLATVGWDSHLPWGVEVKFTKPMDLVFAGIADHQAKTLSQWQAMGLYLAYPNQQEKQKFQQLSHSPLWLVRPDKEVGRAFLVSNNYRTLLHWNRSNSFAISIGKFADRISQRLEPLQNISRN